MFIIIGADQKEYGPASSDELRQWIKDGRADGRTLAKAEGGNEWKPLASFAEFADVTAAGGVPPRIEPPSRGYAPNYSNDPAAPLLAQNLDFDIGQCMGRGWTLLMNNFGVLVGATFLVWLVSFVLTYIPLVGPFLKGVVYGGLYLVYLKRIRGQPATVGGAFAGFGVPFVQLLLAGFLTTLLAGIGSLFCVVPGIYLQIAWLFSLPLVIDKRLEFWTAMELSRTVATRVWFKLFVLTVVVFAPYLIVQGYFTFSTWQVLWPKWQALVASGFSMSAITQLGDVAKELGGSTHFMVLQLAAEVVLLLNLPFAVGAQMYVYETLFGTRPAPAA